MLKRRFRAFTLIELMIVVAIMAVLSAILVPNFIRARERGRATERARAETARPTPRPQGKAPLLESADVRLTLDVQPLRVGLDVANRFQLEHQGRFRWLAGGPGPRLVLFELPTGVDQVEGLRLEYLSGEEWVEPESLVYGQDFVAWEAPADVFPLDTRLAYGARGADRLAYLWPEASKIESLRAALSMEESTRAVLPLGSLRPTSGQDGSYSWLLRDVLAPAPIEIELSAMDSPLGQAGRLFRLTGLAVLLFGAGFWYLAELYRPGSLKDFGFGSFLLLALTYSSFFVSVAVLSLDGRFSTSACLALSLALCLPLLAFHVRQLVDARFALSRTLPLALVTLSLVLLGVYGGSWRAPGFLGLGLLGLAFLTATYRPFRLTLAQRELERQHKLGAAQQRWSERKGQAGRLELALLSLLDEASPELGETRAAYLQTRIKGLRHAVETGVGSLDSLEWAIGNLDHELELAGRALEQMRSLQPDRREPSGNPDEGGRPHCGYCGAASHGGAYCGGCGSKLPLLKRCGGCQAEVLVPVALLPPGQAYHCCACGRRA